MEATMRRSSYSTLIDHGRKAGLQTAEMYAALMGERIAPGDRAGETDGNGLIADHDVHGYPVFKPDSTARPE
jgi:hypothetical protein